MTYVFEVPAVAIETSSIVALNGSSAPRIASVGTPPVIGPVGGAAASGETAQAAQEVSSGLGAKTSAYAGRPVTRAATAACSIVGATSRQTIEYKTPKLGFSQLARTPMQSPMSEDRL